MTKFKDWISAREVIVPVKLKRSERDGLKLDAEKYGIGSSTFLRGLYINWRENGKKFIWLPKDARGKNANRKTSVDA